MQKKSIFISVSIFITCFALLGCTPYQANGLGGGYSEMAMNKNTYQVSFEGNRYTSSDTVKKYLLRRCAELTLNKGYKYFIIVAAKVDEYDQDHELPTTVDTSETGWYSGGIFGGGYSGDATTTITPGAAWTSSAYTAHAIIKMLNNNKTAPNAFDATVIESNFKK